MWHQRAEKAVAEGKVRRLGIVQEQHGDRAALFMQWQGMGWPLAVDALNLLGVRAVPLLFLIDRHGTIRYKNPSPQDFETFLESDYPAPQRQLRPSITPKAESPEYAFLWEGTGGLASAIAGWESEVAQSPTEAEILFRLGVAYRRRFETPLRQPDDFRAAVHHWQEALENEPNQYIWRRRIQQYSPRLDKPYPFYGWIESARETLTSAGETPYPLRFEPAGAELSAPGETPLPNGAPHPDPDRQVTLDRKRLVKVDTTVVEGGSGEGRTFRVFLSLTPDRTLGTHWTLDAGTPAFHPLPSAPFVVEDYASASANTSVQRDGAPWSIDFEVKPNEDSSPSGELVGDLYYYVCEEKNGTCLFLRQAVSIPLE